MNCATKFCRKEAVLRYLGVELCPGCWTKLAEANLAEENEILLAHGLRRVNGAVSVAPKEQGNDERRPVPEAAAVADRSAGEPASG